MSEPKFDVTKISLSSSGKVKLDDQALVEIERNAFQTPVGGTGWFNQSSACDGPNFLWCAGDKNDVCTNYISCEDSRNSQSCRNDYCDGATNVLECV